jgi:hypothetical protein
LIILGARRLMSEEVCEAAITHVPKVWAHARAMQQFNKMGLLDRECFRMMTQTFGPTWKNFRWVSSIPLSVASILNHESKGELFCDTSGATMLRFLARNPQYQVPKGPSRVSVSFS